MPFIRYSSLLGWVPSSIRADRYVFAVGLRPTRKRRGSCSPADRQPLFRDRAVDWPARTRRTALARADIPSAVGHGLSLRPGDRPAVHAPRCRLR